MNLSKEEIIKEIRNGSKIGKEIFEIELSYYKNLARSTETTGMGEK